MFTLYILSSSTHFLLEPLRHRVIEKYSVISFYCLVHAISSVLHTRHNRWHACMRRHTPHCCWLQSPRWARPHTPRGRHTAVPAAHSRKGTRIGELVRKLAGQSMSWWRSPSSSAGNSLFSYLGELITGRSNWILLQKIEVFNMLFDRCHSKIRKNSIKQLTEYFSFMYKIG